MAHENAPQIFTAWILMLQLSSRCHPRGTLARDDGTPMTSAIMALKTRSRVEWFTVAIPILIQIGWLEEVAHHRDDNAITPSRHPSAEGGNGREWKEGKGMEGNASTEIPTLQECQQFATHPTCGFPPELVEEWYNRSCDRGWGKDWQARMRGAVATYRAIQAERKGKGARKENENGDLTKYDKVTIHNPHK